MALGLVHAGQMNWDEALKSFDQGLQIALKLKHLWDPSTILYEVGIVHAKRDDNGDKEKARRVFEEDLIIFTEWNAQPSMDKINKALELIAS